MQVDLGIWNKLTWAVTVLGLLAGVGLVAGSYVPLLNQNERMRRQIETLDGLIRVEETNASNLRASIDAYLHDARTVERLARENLHYAKPGETVIRYMEPESNATPTN
jgi:cell division protein FtsB